MASQLKILICVSATFHVLLLLLFMASAISPEGEALLRWKDTLLNSDSLSSWLHAEPTCYWDGVTCDEGAGYVTNLQLSYSSLNGTLDAFPFAVFRHLALLELSSNDLFGAIPTNISLLHNLTSLDLSFNNLYGTIPAKISLLLNLTTLVLAGNSLVGAIPYQLSRLPKIATLYLENNHLTNPDVTKFSDMPSLQSLFLGGNKLNGTFPQFILNRTWVRLQELDLSYNAFSGLIPENLQDMAPNLMYLDLSSNMFSGHIPRSFSRLAKLYYLNLAENNLTGGIPTELCNISSLLALDLSRNMLFGGIPMELGNLNGLSVMDLSWNMLSGALPPSLSRIQDISEFDVGNNLHLSGNISVEWFKNWTSVMGFHIANNKFTGSISDAFCQLGNLKALDLSDNLLSGVLPDCFWNLRSLIYMDLSSNDFFGEVPTLPNHSSSLESVNLANNNLIGCFPLALKNFKSLVYLDLGGNKFSGTIPSWIGASFPLLRILRLRSNMFHGSISREVSQLSHLQLLDLAENNLTGSIPVSLSNFTYTNMILTSNQVGDYPYERNGSVSAHDGQMDIVWKGRDYTFRRISVMRMAGIDLSSNYLSGEIPTELLNLGAIQFLNLSRNNLSGAIPANIGNLKDVESLDLSWNKLSGPIPSSLSHLMFLNSLNLSNNLLSGEIPTGNQLQTVNDPSIYRNNLGLCGVPLRIPCKTNSSSPATLNGEKEDHHQLETLWLYYSVIAGTVFGFWVWFGVLFFLRIWRFAFFGCIDALQEKFMLKMKRF